MYSDQFFELLLGVAAPGSPFAATDNRTAFNQTVTLREAFMWGVVGVSMICLVFSILVVISALKVRPLAYLSLLLSALTLLVFFVLFFGQGVVPIHGLI